MNNSIFSLKYNDPKNNTFHRAGLNGLYVALSHLCPGKTNALMEWSSTSDSIEIKTKTSDREFLDYLLKATYTLRMVSTENKDSGLFSCSCLSQSDFETVNFHNGILATFLQHPTAHEYTGEPIELEVPLSRDSDKLVRVKAREVTRHNYRDCKPYQKKGLFSKTDSFLDAINLTQWLIPGAIEKHAAVSGGKTRYSEPIEQFLPLLFLPIACSFLRVRSKLKPTKARWGVVVPEFIDLYKLKEHLSQRKQLDYLSSFKCNLEDVTASAYLELKDSGLSKLLCLQFGEVAWSRQTVVCEKIEIDSREFSKKHQLEVMDCVQNKAVESKKGTFANTSFAKELILQSLFQGKHWNEGFDAIVKQQDFGGLKKLTYDSEQIWEVSEQMKDYTPEKANLYSDAFLWQYYEQRIELRNESRGFPNYDNLKSKLLFEIRNCRTQQEYCLFHRDFFARPTWTRNPFILNSLEERELGEFYQWCFAHWQHCLSIAAMTIGGYRRPHKIPRIAEQLGLVPHSTESNQTKQEENVSV